VKNYIKTAQWLYLLHFIKSFYAVLSSGWFHVVFTARHSYASAVLGVVIRSVHSSVCHTRALWLIQRTYWRYFYTRWKGNPSNFLPPNSGWWATSLPPLMGDWSDPPPFTNRLRRQISACNVSTVRASEKSSIVTNRKSYTDGLSNELLMKSSKGWLKKRTFPCFGIKVNFSWMKSATKFLWEKTFSGRVVVHSFPYLTVRRCWGKHIRYIWGWRVKVTHHLDEALNWRYFGL